MGIIIHKPLTILRIPIQQPGFNPRIHVTEYFSDIYHKTQPKVGKHTSPIGSYGKVSSIRFRLYFSVAQPPGDFLNKKKTSPNWVAWLVPQPNARFGKFGSIKTLHMLRTKEWVGSPGTQRHPLKDGGFGFGREFSTTVKWRGGRNMLF